MIYDPDETCWYCSHPKDQHDGEPLPSGCAACDCFLFVSVSGWRSEGRRAEVPQP